MKETRSAPDLAPADGRPLALSAWCVVAAFGTYLCMYAFRKPFTAARFEDTDLWGMGYKTVLVTAQVLGYTFSKFLGIRVVAEVPPYRRAALLLGLIATAEAALLLFGLTCLVLIRCWQYFAALPATQPAPDPVNPPATGPEGCSE